MIKFNLHLYDEIYKNLRRLRCMMKKSWGGVRTVVHHNKITIYTVKTLTLFANSLTRFTQWTSISYQNKTFRLISESLIKNRCVTILRNQTTYWLTSKSRDTLPLRPCRQRLTTSQKVIHIFLKLFWETSSKRNSCIFTIVLPFIVI